MNLSLIGKRLVVIGGTTGIGLSAARAFVEQGAKVTVVGRNKANVKRAYAFLRQGQSQNHVAVLAGDAREPRTAIEAIRLTAKKWGRVDGLFHVAGGSGRSMGDGPTHELTDEGWRGTLELNLTSMMFSNRAAVRQFLKQGSGGTILNTGSVLGWSPSPRHFATHAYATAKAAIVGLTKAMASYYAHKNIRCNVLAPGLVDTPMAQRAARDKTIRRFIKSKQPLDGGRIGMPEDLVEAIVYFMSDASKFVTGQVLAIDGGWCVSEGRA